jgi:tetratricopeptide (TPR) repeat protein
MSRYDAFVSYAHRDAAWVQVLADNLHRAGLDVFLDRWDITTGDRLAEQLQRGLVRSRAVVLVVSSASVTRPWWQEEFAAAVTAAVDGTQRVVPVLLDDVALPPFVASRVRVDFRHSDSPGAYEAAFEDLLRAVRAQPQADRPERDGRIVVPPAVYRAEGPRLARLRITADEVVFSTSDLEARHAPTGDDAGLRSALLDLAQARSRPGAALRGGSTGGLHTVLLEVGRRLGARFLDGPAGEALAEAVRTRGGASVRLAVEVDTVQVDGPATDDPSTDDAGLADLPWETLVLPGADAPLALTPGVELHRAVAVDDPVAPSIPGPLRILAVVASPDSGGGDLLDYEAELGRILAAVDPSRRRDGAYVQMLNWGSPAAIHAALARERFHVLHVSCHATPGALVLESDSGAVDKVDATRFVAEVLVPDEPVPLVVLAGCSTALGTTGEKALPGFARDLLHAGVPAVLAMTAPVTDRYATDLCATLYGELTRRPEPVPLAELSTVRRRLEDVRRSSPEPDPWAEWATPALFQAGPALPLYSRVEAAPARPETRMQLGGMIRKVGDFVGRRPELRAILRDLRSDVPGVVLHGIGGIGKSSLAAEVVGQLGDDAGLVVPVSGTTKVDLILDVIRQRLHALCLQADLDDGHMLRRIVTALIDATPPWEERLGLLAQVVLPQLPILLVLDNAEDLLVSDGTAWTMADDQLAAFLAAWVKTDGTRLVVTTRYPFPLPGRAHKRLPHHHLGPLSEAETRKLLWRLPALDKLDATQRKRAYTDVGGHPRSLEYLDALLAGGDARFDDVADRIETALEKRGIPDAETWLGGVEGDLDRALAETVTLAADDVLLDGLLARLDPLARELLLGAAVYREPVDDIGLQWQVAEYREPEPDSERERRMAETNTLLTRARQENLSLDEVGVTAEMAEQWDLDWVERRRPPLDVPDESVRARDTLLRLGLLAPVSTDPDIDPQYLVHRWTAAALADRTDEVAMATAHRRAAQYWEWRVNVWPQADIAQLIEARHHHHEGGNLEAAISASYRICAQLHTWGAWTWEEDLCHETLGWSTDNSRRAALVHQLGMIAEQRGDYDQAEQHYLASLGMHEELGNRAAISINNHQLGMIAQRRGNYDQAEQHYLASLSIEKELDNPEGIAGSYTQLGNIALYRGDHPHAEQQYLAALEVAEEIDNRPGLAVVQHQLGMVAMERGDYEQAAARYLASLAIEIDRGNRAGIASSYSELGALAQRQGNYEKAEQLYRDSLAIREEIGDRAGTARCYHRLGVVFTLTRRASDGVAYNLTALHLRVAIGAPEVGEDLYWLARQRAALGDAEFRRILAEHLDPESVENVLATLDDEPEE